MKYKVIAKIIDGVIVASKNDITCYVDGSIKDEIGEDRLENIKTGDSLTSKNVDYAEIYWSYTRKEWDRINSEFLKYRKSK